MHLLGCSVPRTLCVYGPASSCCQGWEEAGTGCSRNQLSTALALSSFCLFVCSRRGEGKHGFGRGVLVQQCLCESLLAGQLVGTCCRTPSSKAAGMTGCSGQASCASGRVALSQCYVAFA